MAESTSPQLPWWSLGHWISQEGWYPGSSVTLHHPFTKPLQSGFSQRLLGDQTGLHWMRWMCHIGRGLCHTLLTTVASSCYLSLPQTSVQRLLPIRLHSPMRVIGLIRPPPVLLAFTSLTGISASVLGTGWD